jgi:hypothetical protein
MKSRFSRRGFRFFVALLITCGGLIGIGIGFGRPARAVIIPGDTCLPGPGCPRTCTTVPDDPAYSSHVVAVPGAYTCIETSSDWSCDADLDQILCGNWIEYLGDCATGAIQGGIPEGGDAGCDH